MAGDVLAVSLLSFFSFPRRIETAGPRPDNDGRNKSAGPGEHVDQSGAAEIAKSHLFEPSAVVPAPSANKRVGKSCWHTHIVWLPSIKIHKKSPIAWQ